MVKNNHKTEVFRFVAGVTIVFLFAVMLLPAVAEALETGCDDCTDHGESVCGCVGCPPVIVAYEVPLPEYDQTLNVLKHFMINPSNDFNYNYIDRLYRPPRHSRAIHI